MEKMHLICNAHIDPLWQWEWEEGVGCAISTFRVAADLCEQYDSFIFNHNEAILYKWIEDFEPLLFKKIQELVKKGKWHIMGGWYLQPDCNMPSGESFVRQILVGATYFQEKFGVRCRTAINFDPFGHSKGLVQIMQKAGYDSYIICRPPLDIEGERFIWKGFCDSEITVLRRPAYNTALGNAHESIMTAIEQQKELKNGVILWGVGNHGGGPSKIDLERITKLISESKDVEIIHSTPEEFFDAIKDEKQSLPVIEEGLNPTMVGCYTSQIRIKQKHRHLEHELSMAEKMATHAHQAGLMEYPTEKLDSAWEKLLFSQFHDIIPGSSIQQVEEAGLRLLDTGIQLAKEIKTKAFFKLASGQIKAKDGELPILVYNAHPYKTKGLVECEFMLADQNYKKEFTMPEIYCANRKLPCQTEKEMSNLPIDWRKRVIFEAELEPLSMNRFDVRLKILPEKPKVNITQKEGYIHFKTDEIEVKINTKTGLIDSYKVKSKEFIKTGTAKILAIKDNEDPWGMTVDSFQEVIGAFELATPEKTAYICGVKAKILPSVRVIEDGEVRTVVEAIFEYINSQAVVQYYLPKSGSEIKIKVRIIYVEKNTMLKFSIPTIFENGNYIGKVAYGVDNLKTDGKEVVAGPWTIVSDQNYAVSCINTGNYGSSFENGEIRISLVRSAAYCAYPIEDREIIPQDRFSERIDQGERIFEFYLNASLLDERREKIENESLYVHEKPYAVCFFPPEDGEKPKPLCIIDNPIIELAAIKQAQDKNGFIIRLFNPDSKQHKVEISLPCLNVKTNQTIKPDEIVSLRIHKGTVELVSLLEEKLI